METKKITYETYEDIQNATMDRSMNSQIGMLEENQKACLIDFKNHLILRGLSKCTLKTYVMTICQLLRYAKKPAEQLTKEDIENFLISRQNLKQKTRLSNFITLKMFLKWLKKDQYMSDIHIKRCLSIKLPEEMLTLDEIKRMIQVATNFRDKAIVFTLYETATRQGELLNLKIKHVSFDNHGAIIIIPNSIKKT
jgi:integrase